MWISRKKYNDMAQKIKDLEEQLKLYEDKFDIYFKNNSKEIKSACEKMLLEEDIEVIKKKLQSGFTTRTKLCKDIGISFRTLRNVLNGEKIKPSTAIKLQEYTLKEYENQFLESMPEEEGVKYP